MIIDYKQPITRDHLNKADYDAKFAFIDNVVSSKTPSPQDYLEINNDVTKFTYMFFRLDNEPFKLYDYQDLILNDPHRWIYFRAANQIGKSKSLDADATFNLVRDQGKSFNLAIVSKSLPQATERMRSIKGLLNTANISWRESRGISDSMSVITVDILNDNNELMYTNTLICAPCTEGLLGYALHKLYLDEFEFWDIDTKYFYQQIAEPRTYKTKGQIIIFSNPNGADSYGAELESLFMPSGNRKFHTYVFDYMDCPGNLEEDLEAAKVGKTRAVIESTLLAIRTISSRNYFTPEEIEKSFDKDLTQLAMVGKQPFFFLDVGAKHDQSVLVGGFVEPDEQNPELMHLYIPIIHCYPVGYPLTRVVGVEVDDSDGWHYETSVKEHLEEWSKNGIVPIFGVDVTGNSGISPLFQAISIYPEDVTFSGPVKSGMYQRFKYYLEKGLLHRIKSDEFDYQARHLEMKKSVRGYLMIHHENEDDLDDVMDSVAGLIHISHNPDFIEPSLKMI